MHMVQIRNLPESVYMLLNEEAQRQHRSLGQQAIFTIAEALNNRDSRPHQRLELVAELRAELATGSSQTLSSAASLIREDRDR